MKTKFGVLKTYVWSILLYRWPLTKDVEKNLEATEMWFIRRMLRFRTNEYVFRKANMEVSNKIN